MHLKIFYLSQHVYVIILLALQYVIQLLDSLQQLRTLSMKQSLLSLSCYNFPFLQLDLILLVCKLLLQLLNLLIQGKRLMTLSLHLLCTLLLQVDVLLLIYG